jgi:hypothetical protein
VHLNRWFQVLALTTSTLMLAAEGVTAQQGGRPGGGGTGRPSFPPGLHDRTLPPGRPFSPPDKFNPPGRARFGEEEEMEAVAGRLARLLDSPAFPGENTLAEAIDAYNYLVLTLEGEDRARPPASFVAAQVILPRELRLRGTRVVSEQQATAPENGREDPYLLPGGTVQIETRRDPWTVPGVSAATPLGFGAEWGTIWAGASYQDRLRYGTANDGAAAVGFGLGDADRWVGVQVGIISFSTVRSGFGDRMGLDVHVHRRFGEMWSVAAGVESLGATYDITRDSGKSVYAVGSRWLQFRDDPDAPFGMAMVSLGVGSGRFQLEDDFWDGKKGVGVFGSFGVRVLQPVTAIAEWTGQDLLLATSVTPFRNQNVAITAGFADLTGAAGDGARFIIGGSLGYSFR